MNLTQSMLASDSNREPSYRRKESLKRMSDSDIQFIITACILFSSMICIIFINFYLVLLIAGILSGKPQTIRHNN